MLSVQTEHPWKPAVRFQSSTSSSCLTIHVPFSSPFLHLLLLLLLLYHLLLPFLPPGARTCLRGKREIATANSRDLASRDINILLLVADHVEEIFTDLPAIAHRYGVRDTRNVINRIRQ